LRRRGTASMLCLSLVLLGCMGGARAQTQCCTGAACPTPTVWSDMFSCNAAHWASHMARIPSEWHLVNNVGASVTKQCISGSNKFKACTTDADCANVAGACRMPKMSAREYMDKYMQCCRHCAWDMKFPVSAPIQVTAGPLANETSELANIPMLDCGNFNSYFNALDTTSDGFLSKVEFDIMMTQSPQKEMVAMKLLDKDSVFWVVDVNKDKFVSLQEYLVFRHFWTPTLISNSAPRQPTGKPLAMEQYGGFYLDNATNSVWVTSANNLMLRLYLANRWNSAETREPRKGEETQHMRLRDLDGSTRISFDEHYFGEFADLDKDGFLSKAEFDISLYNPLTTQGAPTRTSKSADFAYHGEAAATDIVAWLAGRPHLRACMLGLMLRMPIPTAPLALSPADDPLASRVVVSKWVDSFKHALNQVPALADLDGDLKISYMERKRVVADRNEDGSISATEWAWGDFPIEYGPFDGHRAPDGVLRAQEYKYYMSYHGCTVRGSILYSRPISEYPWDPACPIELMLHPNVPFAPLPTTTSALPGIDDRYPGYAMRVMGNITERLLWQPKVTYLTEGKRSEVAKLGLGPPDLATNAFKLALITEDTVVPAEWTCTPTIFPSDGFVVVTRSNDAPIVMYLIAGKLVISPHFVNFFCSLFFFILVVGHVIWIMERWTNAEIFRPWYGEGVMDGLWWAIVTQTTVGYGDKAPLTGFGMSFAVVWMLFGLIMFGVFSGQVTSFIEEEQALNNLAGAADLAGLMVGVLDKNRDMSLGQAFAFTTVRCSDLITCGTKLRNKEISAIMAPRADVMTWWQESKEAFKVCGNDFKIVGGTIPKDDLGVVKPAVRVCSYSKSVYGGVYLTNGIASMMQQMIDDNSIDQIKVEEQQSLYIETNEGTNGECTTPSEWDIPMIVISLCVLIFYSILNKIHDSPRAMAYIRQVFGMKQPAPADKDEDEEQKMAYATFGKSIKPKKNAEDGPKLPGLSGSHTEELISAAKKLGVFTAMQATDIRRMQRELKEQTYILERMLKFFGFCGIVVLSCLAIMVGILIVVWGGKVQMARYDQ